MTHACDPSMQEAEAREAEVQGKPDLQSETLFKQTNNNNKTSTLYLGVIQPCLKHPDVVC